MGRADSHNGCFSRFEVYQGRGSNTTPELGLGGSVVKTLTRPLEGKFHHVFMDNFFTSPALFTDLLQDRIYACGTVRNYQISHILSSSSQGSRAALDISANR